MQSWANQSCLSFKGLQSSDNLLGTPLPSHHPISLTTPSFSNLMSDSDLCFQCGGHSLLLEGGNKF